MEGKGANGEWGGICQKDFDINEANIICRMLGFPSATGTINDLYGDAPLGDKFVLSNLLCTGKEASVFECPHSGEWSDDCEATEIAAVQCATSKLL